MQFYKSDLLQYVSGSISDIDLLEKLTELGLEVDQSKKEKNDLLKKCERVSAMMTEPIPQRLRVEFLG